MEARHTIDNAAGDTAGGSAEQRARSERSAAAATPSGESQRRGAIAELPTQGRLGHYDLKATLGSGGFGVVYQAWDTRLGRPVAVKVPRFDVKDQRKLRRFLQEARAAARLQHPGIVAVIAEGVENDKPYMVAEFVDGRTLAERIESERPERRQAVAWVRDLALALQYAHDQGVVHRDIKPDNVMLAGDGRVRIMDFGLAKQLDDDSSLSIDGSVLGTPSYMAPEQARGEIAAIDGRSDQYSLGVVLYELLTGKKPFSGPPHAVLAKVADANHDPPPPRSRDATIPKDLEAICQRAMSNDPVGRYADMGQFAADLDRWLEGKPTDARPLGPHERVARWCRRNPALAGSGAVIAAASLVIALLAWSLLGRGPGEGVAQAETSATATSDVVSTAAVDDGTAALVEAAASESAVDAVPAEPPANAPAAPSWQPTPEQQAFLDEVAALPVEEQASAVARKLQEVNPGFDGEFEQAIENEKVVEFEISTLEVENIWPVRALIDLRSLSCRGTPETRGKLADLSALSGMTMSTLNISNNQVENLLPIAGMPLIRFACGMNNIRELTALAEMQLQSISCYWNPCSDLSPLRGSPLEYLSCGNSKVSDLSPVAQGPLARIKLGETLVSSLTPLRNLQIVRLDCNNTIVADFEPLVGLPLDDLRIKILLFYPPEELLVRSLPASKLGEDYKAVYSASDFWNNFEGRRVAAEAFATETGRLPPDQKVDRVKEKLAVLNGTDEIELATTRDGGVIDSAVVRLTSESTDITPLRALSQLKKLTIGHGRRWLDLSPINSAPIEDLICLRDQAMRNRLMLADIETLKTINGQPAGQYLEYLKSLSEPQSEQPPTAIPTEEEILAAHPPLDEWLEGREILTVAQDGSAMFTTIQDALNAQRDGQVVQVLDKGPYRESINWSNKNDCGLISTVSTILEVSDWQPPNERTTNEVGHRLWSLNSCRLHGFEIRYNGTSEKRRYPLHTYNCGCLCIDSCVLIPDANSFPGDVQVNYWKSLPGKRVAMLIRNCVFLGAVVQLQRRTSSGCFVFKQNLACLHNDHGGVYAPAPGREEKILQNMLVFHSSVFLANAAGVPLQFPGTIGEISIHGKQNTITGMRPALFYFIDRDRAYHFPLDVAFLDSIHLTSANDVDFAGETRDFLIQARDSWEIKSNYSNATSSGTGSHLSLGDAHPTEIRVLSTDPLDRDFMRVDPESIQVPEGDPFPGALPPGPAPPEGDWFTRLQQRFREALEYLPEQERSLWTRPIQLPKVDAANAVAGDDATGREVAPEPRQPRRRGGAVAQGTTMKPTSEQPADEAVARLAELAGRGNDAQADAAEPADADAEMPARDAPKDAAAAGDGQPARVDRNQLPRAMRNILRMPGMAAKMDQLEDEYVKQGGQGFFVYGRVGSRNVRIEPRWVEARLPVAEGGFFIDLVAQAGRPIGFALHGHESASVVPAGPPDGREGVFAEDLGEILLKSLTSRQAASAELLVRRLTTGGQRHPVAADWTLTVRPSEINHVSDRRVPRGADDGSRYEIRGQTSANGLFSLKGLSPAPAEYELAIDLPGHLSVNETRQFRPGNNGRWSVTLEEKIPIRIETIVRKDGKFKVANRQQAWLAGGDRWKLNMPKPVPRQPGAPVMGSMGSMGSMRAGGRPPLSQGYGGTILQADGKLSFQVAGVHTAAKKLGQGTLEQYLDVDPRRRVKFDDADLEIEIGHVYLLRSWDMGLGMASADRLQQHVIDSSDYALVRVVRQD